MPFMAAMRTGDEADGGGGCWHAGDEKGEDAARQCHGNRAAGEQRSAGCRS